MDLAPLEQAAVSASAVVVSACAVLAATYIQAHVRNARLRACANTFINFGAGVAHAALVAGVVKGGTIDWSAMMQAAVAKGVAAAQQQLPQITEAEIIAALAPLIAMDNTLPPDNRSTSTAAPAAPALPPVPVSAPGTAST